MLPDKIAIRRRDAYLVVSQHPHVTPDHGPQVTARYDAVGFGEHIEQAFLESLPVNILAARNDDDRTPGATFSPSQYIGGLTLVLDPTVCTRSDDHLVHPDVGASEIG